MKNENRHKTMEGFGGRLQDAMNYQNISQLQLSKKIGISQPEIHLWLKSDSFPRLAVAQRLAFTLDISYLWLKYGDGEMEIKGNDIPFHEYWSNFPDRLSYHMWTRKKSPVTLCKKINVSYAAIEMWMEGKRRPNEENLLKLTEYFKLSDNWLSP